MELWGAVSGAVAETAAVSGAVAETAAKRWVLPQEAEATGAAAA